MCRVSSNFKSRLVDVTVRETDNERVAAVVFLERDDVVSASRKATNSSLVEIIFGMTNDIQ